ncbi:hypothetical protein DSM3645_11347 [Blastopirellula marina DSM 3645]|uniref:Uncharacterized protein n=1 Tax=Blastopirellula marina DSM 3645 TaxID=314230 RepID=A3ZT11_9BACT|nr:hypothetical protein DSM3645_11347 [Blastopirellula marina DSM 3645]
MAIRPTPVSFGAVAISAACRNHDKLKSLAQVKKLRRKSRTLLGASRWKAFSDTNFDRSDQPQSIGLRLWLVFVWLEKKPPQKFAPRATKKRRGPVQSAAQKKRAAVQSTW